LLSVIKADGPSHGAAIRALELLISTSSILSIPLIASQPRAWSWGGTHLGNDLLMRRLLNHKRNIKAAADSQNVTKANVTLLQMAATPDQFTAPFLSVEFRRSCARRSQFKESATISLWFERCCRLARHLLLQLSAKQRSDK
jgi:hypothetical protein